MSNSTRNTIIISVLLLLISTFWLVQNTSIKKKTLKLVTANKATAISIEQMKTELATIDELRAEYKIKEALMGQQSKLILGVDSPTITYSYLLDILKWGGLTVNYDFAANAAPADSSSSNEYIISGTTRYANLLNLAHQIENQRAVLTIEDFSIGTEGAAKADTVSFSMILHTHYRSGGPSLEELTLKKLERPFTGYALFHPRLSEEILDSDIDSSLLNVEDAKLIGIARGLAFFRDSQGIIRILSRGTKVAYGYLYRIDEAAGKVVFKLAKYGLEEDFTVLINNKP